MNKKGKDNYKLQIPNVKQTKGRELKWYNNSKKSKWNAKYKDLHREEIMHNLKK